MFPLSHMMKSFIRKGCLIVIDAEGKRHVFKGTPGPQVTMRLTDRKLYRTLVFNAELAAGEAYMDGTMRFEEGLTLRDFLTLFSINRLSLGSYPIQRVLRAIKMRFRKRQQSNRKGQAQQNVTHHYDLGNDFYKLFLDDNMLYLCAYFRDPGETLEQAQRNKLRLLASKLDLKPGMKVLDIGCGWGALALYLAPPRGRRGSRGDAFDATAGACHATGRGSRACRPRPFRTEGLPGRRGTVRSHRFRRHVRTCRGPSL
jgi:cyclopropane-fatty-acyl-phospholipid synthase